MGRQVRYGAYVEGLIAHPDRLRSYEAQVNRVDVVSYFYGFKDEFPTAVELDLADHGRRDVLLSWDMGPTRFTDWSSGRFDPYLLTIAAHARRHPHRVYVRPWPEMNGDWQDFQPTRSGSKRYAGTPAEFVQAWRHVVSVIRGAGGSNLRWVFNPTADTNAWTTDIRTIWPGPAHVDVLGLDGFNWGDGGTLRWRGFREIFLAQYTRITGLHPTLPVWICEYGSKEPTVDDGAPVDPAHSKGRWLEDLWFSTDFPRVTALIAFDARKERDWRAISSRDSLAAWRRLVGSTGGTPATRAP